VRAFFQALAPVELDIYSRAVAAKQQAVNQVAHAHSQHLERLQYEVTLAERQFLRVDPDNRLVAGTLETRWNTALAELKRAEQAMVHRPEPPRPLIALSQELQTAFKAIGQHLPTVWQQGLLSQQQKKGLLRCLIDKVVVHRPSPEWVQARIVWRGGETTTLHIAVPVGSLKDLAGAPEMERLVLERSAQVISDEEIARELTEQGYRSPMHPFVLLSTVQILRLKHGQFRVRSQSHPRHVAGSLTLIQLAKALDIAPHWIYDRINNGTIQIEKDVTTHLYLFPDEPATLQGFQQLVKGDLKKLNFSRGHQDA